MNSRFTRMSIMLTLAMALMFSTAISAFAANEQRYDLPNSKGLSFTFTNIADDTGSVDLYGFVSTPVYVAEGPVTVTFEGELWGRQYVEYSVDGKLSDGSMDGEFTYLTLDNQKYNVYREEYEEFTGEKIDSTEDWVVLDSFDSEFWGEVSYPAGATATLTEPGYYLVWGSALAVEGDSVIIHILGEGEEAAPAAPATEEPAPAPAPEAPAVVTAKPTTSDVVVDGTSTVFEAYNINDNNFFKLRDLAAAVNGSSKNFEVTWDAEKRAINLISGQAYTVADGDLTISDVVTAVEVKPTSATLYLDGELLELIAYNINGNNYFKLRDIAQALDIGVTWDAETRQVGIDTSISYTE